MTPPLAFTQLKYALIMFGPSVKSVPGCLVSIVPMLIGVPVAATPGFGPHDDVLVEAVRAVVRSCSSWSRRCVAALLELLLLLLPHPASAISASAADQARQDPVSAQAQRWWCILTLSSSSSDLVEPGPGLPEAADTNCDVRLYATHRLT